MNNKNNIKQSIQNITEDFLYYCHEDINPSIKDIINEAIKNKEITIEEIEKCFGDNLRKLLNNK